MNETPQMSGIWWSVANSDESLFGGKGKYHRGRLLLGNRNNNNNNDTYNNHNHGLVQYSSSSDDSDFSDDTTHTNNNRNYGNRIDDEAFSNYNKYWSAISFIYLGLWIFCIAQLRAEGHEVRFFSCTAS